jgi:hypothetical protein
MSEFQDTTAQEEVVKKEDQLRLRHLNDIRKLVSAPEGRRFYFYVLKEAGCFKSSFTGNSTTFFNEGARNLGLIVLRDLMEAKPEAFTQMMQENYSEIKSFKKLQEKNDGRAN